MSEPADEERQRYLHFRRAYWEAYYTRIPGTRQVPMPFLQTYSEEGEIVNFPPLRVYETPIRNLLPRQPLPPVEPVNWRAIADAFSVQEGKS